MRWDQGYRHSRGNAAATPAFSPTGGRTMRKLRFVDFPSIAVIVIAIGAPLLALML
jgi:hypothetical protein